MSCSAQSHTHTQTRSLWERLYSTHKLLPIHTLCLSHSHPRILFVPFPSSHSVCPIPMLIFCLCHFHAHILFVPFPHSLSVCLSHSHAHILFVPFPCYCRSNPIHVLTGFLPLYLRRSYRATHRSNRWTYSGCGAVSSPCGCGYRSQTVEKEKAGCGRQETHEGEEWQGAWGDNRHSTSVRRRCSCEQIRYVLACTCI